MDIPSQSAANAVKVEIPAVSSQKPNSIIEHALITCTPEQRQTMISEAEYFLAQRRAFCSGHDLEDWLLAESQIDAAIACGELSHVY